MARVGESVKCLFSFEGKEKGQLTMKKGEILTIVSAEENHKGWRQVQKLDGSTQGYVPANYIAAAGPEEEVKVFGVPLPDVMARSCESGEVPRFVDELIRRIEELGGATHSGIFRWPGADQEVKQICSAYDDGKTGGEVSGISTNAADFATVLQRWNRSLPDGGKLIPWKVGSPEMTNLVRLGGASEGAYEDEELLAAVAQLPSHHRAVFDRQMNFLREIDYGEAQMSSMGLAKCVAPDWFGDVFAAELDDQTAFVQKLIARGRPKEVPTAPSMNSGAAGGHHQVKKFEVKSYAKPPQKKGCLCFS